MEASGSTDGTSETTERSCDSKRWSAYAGGHKNKAVVKAKPNHWSLRIEIDLTAPLRLGDIVC
jgi:hypothetical protein